MSYYAVFNVSADIRLVTPSIDTILVASVTSLYFRNNSLIIEKSSVPLQSGEVVAFLSTLCMNFKTSLLI